MSSHTNLDKCECEANLFLKNYKKEIEEILKDERKSLKKVAQNTGDYGTFKETDQESIEVITKIKKDTKDTKQSKSIKRSKLTDQKDRTQSKPAEKPPVVSRKNTQQTKPVEKSRILTATDIRQTKPAEKSKVTESKQKSQLDQDKRKKSEGDSRSSTRDLNELKDTAVLTPESTRISLLEAKSRSQIKIQESKLGEEENKLELLKDERNEQRIEKEKLNISKDKPTTDEESTEKEISPNEYLETTKEQDKQNELEKQDSVIIIYEKESRKDEEELRNKQKAYKTKIEETLRYFRGQKIEGEEYEAEKDYSKIFSKLESSGVDNFLFNPPEMHQSDVVVPDSQKQAEEYLKTHKIYQFFHFLLSHLVAENSSNPIRYLIWLLNECIGYRAKCREPPLLFQKKHIESLFNSMDPMRTGFISINQYQTGMMTLGIGSYRKRPSLTKDSMVTREEFIEEAFKQLTNQLDEMIKTTAQPSTTTLTSYESGYSTPYGRVTLRLLNKQAPPSGKQYMGHMLMQQASVSPARYWPAPHT
ncbi:hypothetical protein CBL_09498 [Carabus blaptoides fortunei]